MNSLRLFFYSFKKPLTAIVIGLFFGALVMYFSGYNPFKASLGMLVGGYGSVYAFTTTLTRATPIIFAGLAGALAWGSGYSSLGAAGQMTLGALASSYVAVTIEGPGFMITILSLLAGIIVGVIVSLLSAWISDRFGLYLLIITLMINYIAEFTASYFTNYVLRDPNGLDASAIQTEKIVNGILPRVIDKFSLHTGFFIALFTVAIIFFLMKKTTFGYKAKMGGLNPNFAVYGGIKSKLMMYKVLAISGGVAGLGGACQVLGTTYRYVDAMISSPGYAWSGIIATLMANNNPVGILFSSVFLAGLKTGGSYIDRHMDVPSEVALIIEGILTLLITAQFVITIKKRKSRNIALGKMEGK